MTGFTIEQEQRLREIISAELDEALLAVFERGLQGISLRRFVRNMPPSQEELRSKISSDPLAPA